MYKKILVPLDGSKRAEAILPHVKQLARCGQATVIFLRVVEPPPLMVTPGQPDMKLHQQKLQQRMEEAESYLKGIRGEFQKLGIDAGMEFGHGAVVEAIINAAVQNQVDLIALASHGRSGLGQVVYGSVAAGVLQRVDRPLLLIRSQAAA